MNYKILSIQAIAATIIFINVQNIEGSHRRAKTTNAKAQAKTTEAKQISQFAQDIINRNDMSSETRRAAKSSLQNNPELGQLVLYRAIFRDELNNPEIQRLLRHGFNINSRNEDGLTLLIDAIRFSNHRAIEQLLELGADLLIQDNNEDNALEWALNRGDDTTLRIIISHAHNNAPDLLPIIQNFARTNDRISRILAENPRPKEAKH